MEGKMARLSLQLGAALVVPIAAQRRPTRGGPNWRIRALGAAAVGSDAWDWPARDRRRPVSRLSLPVRRAAAWNPGRLMTMRLPVVPALISALLAAGCAGVNPVPTTVAIPGMPNPEEALRQSMQHVDAEMAELGRLSPTVAREVQPVMPADLQRVVSFEWNGPLDQAVAKLSASIGYTFYTTAPANAQPLEVSIRMASVPAHQVFQSLGAEAGTRATVQVDPLHHQVQVIHHV